MSATPKRALIVIDVQNEYVGGDLPIEFPSVESSLANIGRAMDAANAAGIPVVVIQHDAPPTAPIFAVGSTGWELHPVVANRPRNHLVNKTMASSFAHTDLGDWLQTNSIDTLTVVGYMTHNCNASTILHASHAGFKVEFLHDASGSLPYENEIGSATAEEIHRVFSVVLQTGFAAVQSTTEWISALETGQVKQSGGVYSANQCARKRAA